MKKNWRKQMEDARAAIPAPLEIGAFKVWALDANTAEFAVMANGSSEKLAIEDIQHVADWLRQTYGVVGKAKK